MNICAKIWESMISIKTEKFEKFEKIWDSLPNNFDTIQYYK